MDFLNDLGLEELWRHILSKIGRKVDKSDYAPVDKTDSMTQAVGKDVDGKLWTAPSGVPTFNPETDEGKVLKIVNGKLSWVLI